MCEWILEHVYIYTGLPWWGTIVATAVGIRLALFWPSVVGIKHAARMAVLQKDPEFIEAQKEMKALMWTPDQDRMSMMKTLAGPIALIPLSYGMFRTLRAMSALPVPSLETGGLAWITDLSVYDPTYLLPLVTSAFSYYTIKLHQASNLNPTPQGEAMGKFMSWGLTPFMFLCTMWFPAACQLFFFAFAVASTAQQSLVVNPSVRRWAQLPPLLQRPMLPSTTATNVKYEAPTRGVRGFLDSASKNVDQIKTSVKEFGGGDAKVAANKAQQYEKKRAQEEKEKLLHRAIEQRRKRAQHNQNKS
jgi:YidC/Oxa1 family membrane protein insertase